MSNNGFTGLSFPFRLNAKGGLKMSTTSPMDFSHIEESITQILLTQVGERVMELYFGSSISVHVFDPSDDSYYSLIKHEIAETLTKFEPRIQVQTEGIDLTNTLDEITGKNFLHITIQYKVVKYNRSNSVEVKIGGN